jgi:putative addiction module component (TIGR02574 family)
MSTTTNQFIATALALPPEDRAMIVTELIRSLSGPQPSPAEQAEIDAAWSVEIERRVRDVEEGREELLDGDEIYRRLRAGQRP